jgi:large subunit ribosomal protein L21
MTESLLQGVAALRTIAHPNFPGQHLPYAIASGPFQPHAAMPADTLLIKSWVSRIFGDIPMYAVIVTGGKQYKVAPGEYLKIEKLEVATGESVTFDRVLLVADGDAVNIGAPVVAGATVVAEVISQGRHDKVRIIKFRRRKHHMKRMGHRQWFTEIKITGIQA